jgi:probable O-glycosylation ligase (exosortase A-associated)
MTVPLLVYLRGLVTYRLIRTALLVGTVLCVFAIVGTQSRGALVGISVMGLFLAWKSKNKVVYLMIFAILGYAIYTYMPESWHERMGTIQTYEEDGSAMGRIRAWRMSVNLALHRPLGGGYWTFRPEAYLMYLPEVGPSNTDAHSIYFETLGEHGFVGLGLFLLIGIFTFLACGRIIRRTRNIPDLEWMNGLARMVQVSLVGYATSGLFLGLAYFDYYYALIAIVVGMTVVLQQEAPALQTQQARPPPAIGGPPVQRPALRPQPGSAMPGAPVPTAAGMRMKMLPTVRELRELGRQWYDRL